MARGYWYRKEIFFGRCRIGKWIECDENGENCQIIDYDKNRGKFGYNDILKFLDRKKFINLKTGDRRDDLRMTYRYEQQTWFISMSDEKMSVFWTDYILDGNTGKILEEKKYAIP